MVAIKFALLTTLASAPAVFGYAKYSALIPNGDALGKAVGHTADAYTPFGTLFSKNGKTWTGVCKEMWPGASVTVGAALGDPCCKWTSGAAQVALSAPNPTAAACDAGAAAPAASSAAPAAATPAPAPGAQTTPKPAAPATAPAAVPTPAPAGPGKVLPAVIPAPAPGSGNSTTPGKVPAPAPTPAGSKPAGKPHKLCH